MTALAAPSSTSPPATRDAARGDVPRLTEVLVAAFREDPVHRWLFPEDATWRRGSPLVFTALLRALIRGGGVVTTRVDLAGAALWAPPGRKPLGWREDLALALRLAPMVGRRGALLLRGLGELEARHPEEPHWYLPVLGTEPAQQRRGVGSALLAPVLARCDAQRTLAWLESSREANVPFYRRHGFEVVETVRLPHGPPVWLMRRRPA